MRSDARVEEAVEGADEASLSDEDEAEAEDGPVQRLVIPSP
jgi:hypothetical protein